MPKVKALCGFSGPTRVIQPGQVVEVTEHEAERMVAGNVAELVDEPKPAEEPKPADETKQTDEPAQPNGKSKNAKS